MLKIEKIMNLLDLLAMEHEKICKVLIQMVTEVLDQIEESGQQNEQYVLNFCDELNKASVRF